VTPQPVLFLLQEKYCVKFNSTAIEVDSTEFLLCLWFVLRKRSEANIWLPRKVTTGRSSVASYLWRVVSKRSQ